MPPLTPLLLLLPTAQSPAAGGVEQLFEALARRTEARREAAATAWREAGPAWLADPGAETAAPLLEHAPEIQDPLLAFLRGLDATDPRHGDILRLLGQVMGPGGALRLATRLGEIPDRFRVTACAAVAERGGPEARRLLESWLNRGPARFRQELLVILLEKGDPGRAAGWFEAVPAADPGLLGPALVALASRPLPAGFRLPSDLLQAREPGLVPGVLAVLERSPDPDAEAFLLEVALESPNEVEVRRRALPLLEAGAEEFRWRHVERRLRAFLEESPGNVLATDVAWSLHRLGEREGARFLLEKPLATVRNRPRDFRARLRLGHLQVELGEFQDAWRSYSAGIDLVAGTPAQRLVEAEDWLFAARAAAGARRLRDAATWLENSRLSPRELTPYRELPEFQSLLRRQPFKRIFGVE